MPIVTRLLCSFAIILSPTVATAQSGFGVKPVDDSQLRAVSGKAELSQIATAEISGKVANNTINGDSTTGTIQFDASSFQGMNGLSILSANTGNNVSINSAMNVNVTVHP